MSNATNKTATQIRMEMERQATLITNPPIHRDIVWGEYYKEMKMGVAMAAAARRAVVTSMFKVLVPIDTFWKNVYQIDMDQVIDRRTVLIKFTFYNDLSMKCECNEKFIQNEIVFVPCVEDFEAWKAEALMKCEAGEDVWPRPKQIAPQYQGGAFSALSQAQMGQNALYRQHPNTMKQQSSMQQSGQASAQSTLGTSQSKGFLAGLLGGF